MAERVAGQAWTASMKGLPSPAVCAIRGASTLGSHSSVTKAWNGICKTADV